MDKLASKNVAKVIDLLSERLAFERASVKLYDTLIARVRACDDAGLRALASDLERHREQEKEHEEWLEEQIRALGGDAQLPTERSLLADTESEGVERVIRRDRKIAHDFHALLTAELADNAGWELLAQIAAEMGDEVAQAEFERRLQHEVEHLALVRRTLLALTKEEVSAPPPRHLAD
jgi:bacterioferritin (cytochrome b1)